MCTAISYKTKDHYFGRTLDYDHSYPHEIVILPKRYKLLFKNTPQIDSHNSIIGMAYVSNGYPLYFDAINDKGLAMAALNFTGNAVYHEYSTEKTNITHYELILYILARASSVCEAREVLKTLNITNDQFNKETPVAMLHWMISDRNETIVVESVEDGLKIYDNPVGVLTNNPPFPIQIFSLNNYLSLTPRTPTNSFSNELDLCNYSRGMGAIGLPGDLSSQSRFVHAAYVRCNSVCKDSEEESVGQFFHILGSVEQQRGCCIVENGNYEITIYSSCCNTDRGIYYYTTYGNRCICAVDMNNADLDGSELIRYPLITDEKIIRQN